MSKPTNTKILEEALILFTEKGYIDTTMNDIAKRVGIKAPSIYEHYSSKKELFFDVLEFCFSKYKNMLENVCEGLQYPVDMSELFKIYKKVIHFMIKNNYNYKFFLRYITFPPNQFEDVIRERIFNLTKFSAKAIISIYEGLITNEMIKVINKTDFVLWFYRMIIGDIFQFIICNEKLNDEKLTNNWELFWSGIYKN